MFKIDSGEQEEKLNWILILTFILLATFGATLFIQHVWECSLNTSAIIAFIIVFSTLTFGVWNWFFFPVKSNHAVIVQNVLKSPGTAMNPDGSMNLMHVPKNQRVCTGGVSAKWPFEKIVTEISLIKEKQITDTVTTQDARGRVFVIEYMVTITPLPGKDLLRYHQIDDLIAEAVFKSYFTGNVILLFAQVDGNDAQRKGENEDGFRKSFQNLLGGRAIDITLEKPYGRFTGLPRVSKIIQDPAGQKASQLMTIIDAQNLAIKKLIDEGQVPPDLAVALVLEASTPDNKNNGARIYFGLPKGLQIFTPSEGSNKKGGK